MKHTFKFALLSLIIFTVQFSHSAFSRVSSTLRSSFTPSALATLRSAHSTQARTLLTRQNPMATRSALPKMPVTAQKHRTYMKGYGEAMQFFSLLSIAGLVGVSYFGYKYYALSNTPAVKLANAQKELEDAKRLLANAEKNALALEKAKREFIEKMG